MSTDDKRFGERRSVNLPDDAPLSHSPIRELQRLAVAAASEQARVQALRLLLDRIDRQRERDDARAAIEAQEGEAEQHDELSEYVRGLTGEALDGELDAMLTHYIDAALAKSDEDPAFPLLVAAFRRAVERHVADLENVGRIEREVERRAQERAESMYRSRSFAAVAGQSEAAPDPTADQDDDQGDQGEPGYTTPRQPKSEPPEVHPFLRGEEPQPDNPLRPHGRRRRPYPGGPHRLL